MEQKIKTTRFEKKNVCIYSKFDIRTSLQHGFSLLELLIVIAIIATVGTIGVGTYRNFGKNVELTSTAQGIASDLKQMQANAMIGQGGYKWGAHFVNSSVDYYELFSTPTTYADVNKVVIATTTLSQGISFSTPSASSIGVALSWTNSVSADFSNVVILRKASTAVTDVPPEGSVPSVGGTIGASTVVYAGSGNTFTDTGVSSGTTYYYKIFSKDTSGNYDVSLVALGPFTP